ncbi:MULTISPECIES: hypothetical protein [Niastella]|uniref:Uncharacterized protein n=1 Tax=Niastella soli TaxID=2821487 RepID=A0ABS3YWC4_9BACT|nr:hypothetical protein [Niastella soli]MBO9202193.1 hypothetical protein [Niastella soli]
MIFSDGGANLVCILADLFALYANNRFLYVNDINMSCHRSLPMTNNNKKGVLPAQMP